MPYIKKETRSGKLLETEVYFSTRYGKKHVHRSPNTDDTPETMEKINEKRAMKRLQRLILANFSRENGDVFMTYTYGMDVTEQEAMKGERNLLERIRRMRRKKGLPELKYIAITEKQSKWHHHIIMNGGLTADELWAVWGERGARIQMSTLDDTQVCEGLARYLTEQHKAKRGGSDDENVKQARRKNQRRWHGSRNLAEPKEKVTTLKREPKLREPKAPKGYRLLPDSVVMGFDMYGMMWSYAAFVKEEQRVSKTETAGRRKISRGSGCKGSWEKVCGS